MCVSHVNHQWHHILSSQNNARKTAAILICFSWIQSKDAQLNGHCEFSWFSCCHWPWSVHLQRKWAYTVAPEGFWQIALKPEAKHDDRVKICTQPMEAMNHADITCHEKKYFIVILLGNVLFKVGLGLSAGLHTLYMMEPGKGRSTLSSQRLTFQLNGLQRKRRLTKTVRLDLHERKWGPMSLHVCMAKKAAFHLSDGNETRWQHSGSTHSLHFTRMPVCPVSKPTDLPPHPKRHIPHLCADVWQLRLSATHSFFWSCFFFFRGVGGGGGILKNGRGLKTEQVNTKAKWVTRLLLGQGLSNIYQTLLSGVRRARRGRHLWRTEGRAALSRDTRLLCTQTSSQIIACCRTFFSSCVLKWLHYGVEKLLVCLCVVLIFRGGEIAGWPRSIM